MTSTPPPASAALPGANDVIAAGGSAAGSGGGSAGNAGGGVLLAAADSGIWRSADSGATWRLEVSGIQAWSVTAMNGGGYAALGVIPGPDAPGVTAGVSLPELATSSDGVSWHVTKLAEPTGQSSFGYGYRLLLTGTGAGATGVAVPDPGEFFGGLQSGYRTTDGGRHWVPLALPRAGGPVTVSGGAAVLSDGRTMFVTAAGSLGGCAGAVYESRDGGASWARLAGSCQRYPLQDVQFTSDRDGFAVGGMTPKFGGGQVVEATTDGGATWRVLWYVKSDVTGGLPPATGFLRIDMLGSGPAGWAVAGGCTGGQNGPCPGGVYVTTDGGVQWRLTGQAAIAVAGVGGGAAGTNGADATTGLGGSAVAVTSRMAAVTRDGGSTWAEQTRPETTGTQVFAGTGGSQLWFTTVSTVVSSDGGEHWSPVPIFPAALATQPANYSWQAASSALLGYEASVSQVWASANGGRTWATSAVPGGDSNPVLTAALGSGDAAYAVTGPGADCLSSQQVKKVQQIKPGWKPPSGASVLYASTDGGARWSGSGQVLPFGVPMLGAMAASGTRIAIIDACGRLELSTDAGAHWTAQSLGKAPACAVSLLGTDVWLQCMTDVGVVWSLHSADGGATWLAYRLPAFAGQSPGIFATGPGSAVLPVGGALWRTTDGGKSWLETWPLAR
jgi:photosystem II stability/assembly factor-like uncharacterized protein